MSKASEIRETAVADLIARFIDETNNYELKPDTTREEIEHAILDLIPLGKSDRWQLAILKWISLFGITESTGHNDLRWVILQGAVHANAAAS